jgi:hypothetical protein
MPVELAVAVCAALPKLARLVTLAGLCVTFSSTCIGLGIEIAFAAIVMPSLIVEVAAGASAGRLMPVFPDDMRDDIALCAGFSLIALPCALCSSCFFFR